MGDVVRLEVETVEVANVAVSFRESELPGLAHN